MNEAKAVKTKKSSVAGEFIYRLTKSTSAKIGIIILFIIILFCLIGPLFSPYGSNDMIPEDMFATPSAAHPFGCDSLGRDIMTRLMYGGRYSLILGISSAILSAAVGIIIGCIAGYIGGAVETIIMRFMDVWSALPAMLLCILISAVMGSGFVPTIIALIVGAIPGGVRMTRGQVLSERNREYIEAAESINCPKPVLMMKHLLPNVIQPMIIIMTMSVGSNITMAASLSYIGLGIQPPAPEWGAMLAAGRTYIRQLPHMITFPGIMIALTVLAVNLLGDGLRDALDPKMRD